MEVEPFISLLFWASTKFAQMLRELTNGKHTCSWTILNPQTFEETFSSLFFWNNFKCENVINSKMETVQKVWSYFDSFCIIHLDFSWLRMIHIISFSLLPSTEKLFWFIHTPLLSQLNHNSTQTNITKVWFDM